MNDMNDLTETINDLRNEKYQDLPVDLILKILSIESEFFNERVKASKQIAKVVEDYLDNIEVK